MSTKNPLLAKIEAELNGIRVTESVTVGGHKYGLATLNNGEEAIVKSLFPETTSLWQAISDQSVQTLAVALKSIDDIAIEALFQIADDLPPEERATALANEKRWRAEQVMKWFSSQPSTFVRSLWNGYMNLQERSNKALDEIKSF